MQQVILTLALFFSLTVVAQTTSENKIEGQTIKVSVTNALNDNGTIGFALYNEANFMKSQPIKATSAKIENGVSTITFENVPEGIYAIICYHDENDNKRMDFQPNGMPKESYGTSNNVMTFGPPNFEDSKFEVKNEDLFLEIKF
jgi:uncharacterized protein (DUF2141 family)